MSDQTFGEGLPVMHITFEEASRPTYAEGDRIYATETVTYVEITVPELNDGVIERGSEGVVVELTGDDAHDLLIEWDAGFLGTVNSGSVALISDFTDPPRFPIGTPEYDAYAAELRAELAKFAAGEPPYGHGETGEPNMVGVNPAADPAWVAERDRASKMTNAEAAEYYAALKTGEE